MFSFGEQLSIILFELCVTVFDYSLQYWSEPQGPQSAFEVWIVCKPNFCLIFIKIPIVFVP